MVKKDCHITVASSAVHGFSIAPKNQKNDA
jgi:hypothetical protein